MSDQTIHHDLQHVARAIGGKLAVQVTGYTIEKEMVDGNIYSWDYDEQGRLRNEELTQV